MLASGSHAMVSEGKQSASGVRDIDHDGTDDCWKLRRDRGGGYGGATLTIQRSCRGPAMVLSGFAPVSALVVASSVPMALGLNPALLEGGLALLLGDAEHRSIDQVTRPKPPLDASMAWILDRYRYSPFEASFPLREIRRYRDHWVPGRPMLPTDQYTVIDDPEHGSLAQQLAGDAVISPTRAGRDLRPYALVIYRASQHGVMEPTGRCGKWELYTTGRGVIAYDPIAESHSWTFISHQDDRPGYRNIMRTECAMGLVVIERWRPTGSELVVSAPDLGRYAELGTVVDSGWGFDRERRQLVAGDRVYDLMDLRYRLAVPDPS